MFDAKTLTQLAWPISLKSYQEKQNNNQIITDQEAQKNL